MRSPIGYDDYKHYLRDVLEDHGAVRGYQGQLAQAARCQKSYFSQVLRAKTNLTPEQALRLAAHWRLASDDAEYFLLLVDLGRTSYAVLQARIKGKLQGIQQRRENLAERYTDARAVSEGGALYYSSWHWIAVHMAVSVPALQTAGAIAEHLGLRRDVVARTLEGLEAMGLVRQAQGRWSMTPTHLHLPKESPLVTMHHASWRQRAVLDAQMPGSDAVHYTVVQSHSRADFGRLKTEILETLDRHRAIVRASPEEEVTCLNVDFFRLGG